MRKYTQKTIKEFVKMGFATDITNADSRNVIPNSYTQVGYSSGVNGCNGALLQDDITGELYAITSRSSALFRFV